MIVLDTNVLSEAMKLSPDPAVARWMVGEHGRGLFTTAVSEAEIIYGVAILPDGRRKRDLEAAAHGMTTFSQVSSLHNFFTRFPWGVPQLSH